jgi:hypothetical protein
MRRHSYIEESPANLAHSAQQSPLHRREEEEEEEVKT